MENLLTRAEAARVLGISITTLDQLRFEGLLPYVQFKSNGKVWIKESSIIECINKHSIKGIL